METASEDEQTIHTETGEEEKTENAGDSPTEEPPSKVAKLDEEDNGDSPSDQTPSKVTKSDEEAKSENNEDSQSDEPQSKVAKLDDNGKEKEETNLAPVIAAHYNTAPSGNIEERKTSRIFFMRNFNNFIKSMLIEEQLRAVKDSSKNLTVLDLCSGKGGDLQKWIYGRVNHVIFVDIASVSVEASRERYRARRPRFTADFLTADCTKELIKEKLKDEDLKVDLVSCQFAFHYCFESLEQAQIMLRNASENLRSGGRFFGTMPNAAEIVRRLREQPSGLKNGVFSLTAGVEEPYPLFKAIYDFKLDGVVDCPEFLVHFPTFVKLASSHGLKLVSVRPMPRFFNEQLEKGRNLLERMKGLETYEEGKELVGAPEQYLHAKNTNPTGPVQTLTADEWDVVCLYLVFVFEKV